MRELAIALAGVVVGALGMYLFSRRVELALRMMLDRRDRELAKETERVDQLVQLLTSLRRDGFVGSRAGDVRQPPDPEGQALARAETQQRKRLKDEQFLKRAVAKLKQDHPGIGDAKALKEARRLLENVRMEQPDA